MESQYRRRIKDGSEYDHLFPTPQGKHITILKDAEVGDTVSLIKRTVPQTLKDTEKIASILKGKNLEETCSNIWHFVYNYIQYKRDEKGIEQVRRPARTWWDRTSGVDCDCYTEFISSILTNLGIPHKLRITKYNGKSYYQHIYPIVPYDGNVNKSLTNRSDYIVIDCVKDAFDDEQVFSGFKDYDMRLDYLNGLDDHYKTPENTDIGDLASLEEDHELNGKFGKWLKNTTKKVGDAVGKGIRFINRFTNPATILLRNGFLLAMKINLMRVAGKLRYAYLSDEQARALGMNIDALNKLRKVKDKAETIYWQAGGKKENLKKAILGGKGNKDHKVPMNGLEGLDDVYADEQEYNIIRYGNISGIEGLGELGDPASGTAIAAATGAVSAIAAALSQIKDLFKKGTPEAQEFNQNTNATTETTQDTSNSETASDESGAALTVQTPALANRKLALNPTSGSRVDASTDTSMVTTDPNADTPKPQGFMEKATTWVKENPGKSLLIAGALLGGGYMLMKKKDPPARNTQGLNGISKKKGKKRKRTSSSHHGKSKIRTIEI
jgi:hypothetical protein